jgi:DNA mismatch repair protein MutS
MAKARKTGVHSPMMAHYVETKKTHPNGLLFYRVGDFFELFFEDAVRAGKMLGLTCTSRQQHNGEPIPMAGVPHHAIEGYIDLALQAGVAVVMVDQVEDPAQAKGIVKRAVTRIETPGTVVREDRPGQTYLAAIAPPDKRRDRWGVAVLDLSCADFRCTDFESEAECAEELRRLEVQELIVPEAYDPARLLFEGAVVPLTDSWFARRGAGERLKEFLGCFDLKAFDLAGAVDRCAAAAAAAQYVAATRPDPITHVRSVRSYERCDRLHIDAATLRNLEVFSTLSGERSGSLFHALDLTETLGGKRALAEALRAPLIERKAINARHDRVQAFVDDSMLRTEVRQALGPVGDLDRIATRLALGGGNPRQLRVLANSLLSLPALGSLLARSEVLAPWFDDQWSELAGPPAGLEALGAELDRALVERPPVRRGDAESIAAGFDQTLDASRALATHGAAAIEAFQTRQRDATGIPTLKVRQNRVFGYFIEVSARYLERVPETYRRKQTIANGERYIDTELDELAAAIAAATGEADSREEELFRALREHAAEHVQALQRAAALLAELDLVACFAELAERFDYQRPQLLEADSQRLHLEGCRHPVVERNCPTPFVPNDLDLGGGAAALVILTGPNMGGKSTVMRQAAIAVLMGQAGAFVAASKARFALRDRVFTRVGASDDLAGGRSTFMVEMTETANILHGATAHSLVLLDEIGRGTATFDGLSLAWAVAEDLVDRIKCLGLFATHYHELCDLADTRAGVANMRLAVREWNDEIHFLRQLEPGGASRSYGIQVARLAGLPTEVVGRAGEILHQLEVRERDRSDRPTLLPPSASGKRTQLNLFGASAPEDKPSAPELAALSELAQRLRRADLNRTTPMEALRLLDRLQRQLLDEG